MQQFSSGRGTITWARILGHQVSYLNGVPRLLWWGPTSGAAWVLVHRLARLIGVRVIVCDPEAAKELHQAGYERYLADPGLVDALEVRR